MMTQEFLPDKKDASSGGERVTADPEIELNIARILHTYRDDLQGQAAHDYQEAQDQGECIDIVCLDLGAKLNIKASTELKALRYVRAFSRELYGAAPRDKEEFEYTLLDGHKDYDYWRQVDHLFMENLKLEVDNAGGEFYGEPNFSDNPNGRSDYAQIATINGHGVFKSAYFIDGAPIHVFYRAEPLI